MNIVPALRKYTMQQFFASKIEVQGNSSMPMQQITPHNSPPPPPPADPGPYHSILPAAPVDSTFLAGELGDHSIRRVAVAPEVPATGHPGVLGSNLAAVGSLLRDLVREGRFEGHECCRRVR